MPIVMKLRAGFACLIAVLGSAATASAADRAELANLTRSPFVHCAFYKAYEIDPVNGPKVRRIFELYAFHGLTLDSLLQRLGDEGVIYTPAQPRFHRSKGRSPRRCCPTNTPQADLPWPQL